MRKSLKTGIRLAIDAIAVAVGTTSLVCQFKDVGEGKFDILKDGSRAAAGGMCVGAGVAGIAMDVTKCVKQHKAAKTEAKTATVTA